MFQQSPALAQSKSLRFTTLCLLYVCQGLPIGIFQVALPAWFAAEGLSVSEIGGFIAIVFLPWGFKLLAGPLMDRFAFPPMGRRRPWILLAQMGIIGSFLLIAFLSPDPKESYYLLAALGFLANFFGAVQDVAVDGMAIDILKENERAEANAYMFGGQVGGISISGAFGSAALVNFGLSTAALIIAFAVFFIMLLPLFLRERPGERLVPWSTGEASAEALASVNESWRDIVVILLRALILPMSLLLVGCNAPPREYSYQSVLRSLFSNLGGRRLNLPIGLQSLASLRRWLVLPLVRWRTAPVWSKYSLYLSCSGWLVSWFLRTPRSIGRTMNTLRP
jgi:PAT family beta-lactamase induction signal transducer AmpG|tara:strand:- start:787 stop:1794 length:1008 start_codon:yes stop_codon:yes gene_type:complete